MESEYHSDLLLITMYLKNKWLNSSFFKGREFTPFLALLEFLFAFHIPTGFYPNVINFLCFKVFINY